MIDWARVQSALDRAGHPCGAPDGAPGPLTFTALFAYAADRDEDAGLHTLGRAGAAWLPADPICVTPTRLAEFVAQCANETGGFRRFEENLRYSAAAMVQLWPRRFTRAQALASVGKPKEIAARAYGGRMGNAPYPALDGWTYRGRGMLQLTGKDNYALFGRLTGLPLLEQPDLAADPADSLVIAREFWRRGRVNDAIDRGDFTEARRITNGGSIGMDHVAALRRKLLEVLS